MTAPANTYRLLILPGDGIGQEVMAEVRRVAEWFRDTRGLPIDLRQRPFGLASWQAYGSLMPDETWAEIEAADAILFGPRIHWTRPGKSHPKSAARAACCGCARISTPSPTCARSGRFRACSMPRP